MSDWRLLSMHAARTSHRLWACRRIAHARWGLSPGGNHSYGVALTSSLFLATKWRGRCLVGL
jgi:hypothetical protein